MSLFGKKKPAPVPPVVPSTVSPVVAVVNESTAWTDAQVKALTPALQAQMDDDFGPLWNLTCKLVQVSRGGVVPKGAWILGFFDDADQAGALGYHDITADGTPIAKVFVKTAQQYGYSVSVTASHELCEMMADAGVDLMVQMNDTQGMAFETCDPVEDDSLGYEKLGQLMSDFCTPWYFMAEPPHGKPMSFRRNVQSPFQISPGGYANILDFQSGQWNQVANGASARAASREHRTLLATS